MPDGKIGKKKLSRVFRREKISIDMLPSAAARGTIRTLKISKRDLSEHFTRRRLSKKYMRKKIPFRAFSFAKVRITNNTLKWVLLVIFFCIAVGAVSLAAQQGTQSIKDIVVYSVMGFVTFFMGYFGWWVACMVRKTVSHKKLNDDF